MLRRDVACQLVSGSTGERVRLGDQRIRLGDGIRKFRQSAVLHLELVSGGISESYQGVLAMLANTPVCCQSLFFT